MADLNQVYVTGKLIAEPKIIHPAPRTLVKMRINVIKSLTTESRRNADIEWYDVVLNDYLADLAVKYLQKGSRVFIRGELGCRTWLNASGTEITGVFISAQEVRLLTII